MTGRPAQLQLASAMLPAGIAPALRRDRQSELADLLAARVADASRLGGASGQPGEPAARVTRGRAGRPSFAQPWHPLSLSIAHSGTLVLAGCAPVVIGLDCERDRQISEVGVLAGRVLPAATAAAVRALPAEQRSRAFLQHWTRLEAISKASGIALTRLLRTEPDASWHCYQFDLRAGYLVAVATAAPVTLVEHHLHLEGV